MENLTSDVKRDAAKVDRILASATNHFANDGYTHAKTNDIAAHAAVSKGLIFHYYGDKPHLYLATVTEVFKQLINLADFTVWTDANDLSEMIERAVRYKIKLQLAHPAAFRLVIQSLSEAKYLPVDVSQQINTLWQQQTTMSAAKLMQPVLDKMNVRANVDQAVLRKLLAAIADQAFAEAQTFMRQHPKAKIEDFDPIIAQIRSEFDIIEHGILNDN